MREYEVKRSEEPESRIYEAIAADGSVLRFTGELIAEVSAELPEKDRWSEFKLYLTSFDTWVLQGAGCSRIKGEKTRYWYVVSSDPSDWLDKILGDETSRLAKRLLRDSFMYLRNCDDLEEDYNERS